MVVLIIRYENEAPPLMRMTERAVSGLQSELSIIVLTTEGNGELRPADGNEPSWVKELKRDHEVLVCGGAKKYQVVEEYLIEQSPDLVIAGKHYSKVGNQDTEFSHTIYYTLSCQTLLVRIGVAQTEHAEEVEQGPILVAAGQGIHTQSALKVAHAIAGEKTVALHLTADVDIASSEYAQHTLDKIIHKSGVSPEEIQKKVVLGVDLSKVLREEISAGFNDEPYDMLLLGSSNNRGLREKLFGTIPEKMVNKADGLTIGVIRAAQPTGHRFKESISRLIRVRIPQLERSERLALFDEIELKSKWSFDFAALMTLAALVAGLGLLANSGAVVIGAMLIAPLMMPLIGSGLALAQGNTPLFKNAIFAVIRGFLFALLSGFFLGALASLFQIPLTGELAARGEPTLLDLGVAFVSGIAASYCIARPTLTGALAGVSIAAALVPPIVTVGVCLITREMSVAKGASLLFGTNVVAVIFGAALNFSLGGIYGQGKAGEMGRRFMFVLALACLALAVPLSSVLLNKIPRLENSSFMSLEIAEAIVEKSLPSGSQLLEVTRKVEDNVATYQIQVENERPLTIQDKEDLELRLQGADSNQKAQVKVILKTNLVVQ